MQAQTHTHTHTGTCAHTSMLTIQNLHTTCTDKKQRVEVEEDSSACWWRWWCSGTWETHPESEEVLYVFLCNHKNIMYDVDNFHSHTPAWRAGCKTAKFGVECQMISLCLYCKIWCWVSDDLIMFILQNLVVSVRWSHYVYTAAPSLVYSRQSYSVIL